MVATVVVPRGSTHKAGGDTYCTIGINEQNREACTRCHTLTHRLRGALIGLLAQGVVVYTRKTRDIGIYGTHSIVHRSATLYLRGEDAV